MATPAPVPPLPRIGTVIHFRNGPLAIELGHKPCDCLHSLVTRHEAAGTGTIALALRSPLGWHIYHNIPYAPLPACDVSGTYHPADEHSEGEA